MTWLILKSGILRADIFSLHGCLTIPNIVYTERNEARKELKNFPNLDSLKGAPFEFNLIPVSIAAGIDLTEILGNKVSEEWEQSFLNQLRNRIQTYGLSLPFLFLTTIRAFSLYGCLPQNSFLISIQPDIENSFSAKRLIYLSKKLITL